MKRAQYRRRELVDNRLLWPTGELHDATSALTLCVGVSRAIASRASLRSVRRH
jgi:hypothetical protein